MKQNSAGFTLLELMLAIALLAILLGIGVPNFQEFVRNSRMTSAANDIVSDFSVARSEAVKRRVPVTLCKSSDLVSCDDDAGVPFSQWIIFVDDANPAVASADDGNGVVDAGEAILRARAVADSLTVSMTPADAWRTTFLPSGFPFAGGGGNVTVFVLCDDRGNATSVGGNSAARAVRIMQTGRPVAVRDQASITAQGGCP